jgi:hypothetical protein
MRVTRTGLPTIIMPNAAGTTAGFTAASSGSWYVLPTGYSRFAMRCCRASSIGTSNFSVSLRGSLSTKNTTGALVGAIGAYTPSTLLTVTQATVGKVRLSTGLVPARCIKAVVVSMTASAGRTLRIEVAAVPS